MFLFCDGISPELKEEFASISKERSEVEVCSNSMNSVKLSLPKVTVSP